MWYTSRKSGLTPSLQATLAQIPVDFCLYLYYFFPPPPAALCSYIRLFLSFCLPPPLCLTHACTHKANIYTPVSVLWWIILRDGRLLHQGRVCCEPKNITKECREGSNQRERERFHAQVSTTWVPNENLWTASHCHPQAVISVICNYQRFSCHWFSLFSNKRKIAACSPLLLLPATAASFLSPLCIMYCNSLVWGPGLAVELSV